MKIGKLYIVGTPIGNLGDFSPRAVETLKSVDFIAAEDTRVTIKLLNHFDIHKPMLCYFEHNIKERGEVVIDRILAGESCALVTDAGMPAISDPGQDLVRLAHENGITVFSVPGPTAFATAVAMSGMTTSRFTFEGFLSGDKPRRKEHLESLRDEKRTMIFYEAPHKLSRTLSDFEKCFGAERKICIVREITKIYEEVMHTTVGEAAEEYAEGKPKGEYVLIVEGAAEKKEAFSLDDALKLADEYVSKGFSPTAASKLAAKESGLKKGDIYRLLVDEREGEKDG